MLTAAAAVSPILQLVIVLACLVLGTRYGGLGLGLIGGIGLTILVFAFRLVPGKPPIDVMLTILAVIACASVLQAAGGIDVMMQFAEKILRKHPERITILAPLTTWLLTILCGTGHVVYTMYPIIADISLGRNIRPERPMAVSSVCAQLGICASPVSVATVTVAGYLGTDFSIPQILAVTIPATFVGALVSALWSTRRGKDLDDDPKFQKLISDPEKREYVYSGSTTLIGKVFPKTALLSTRLFFTGIAVVVVLGAFPMLRPLVPGKNGGMVRLDMALVIQMVMLVVGALILIFAKVQPREVTGMNVFAAGTTAIISVFGVAWMAETFFGAHLPAIQGWLTHEVSSKKWIFAIALFLISKLVNSQAAALIIMLPIGLQIGLPAVVLLGFIPACYGYFVLPTYPSDLAAIGFDRTGTTRIGKYVLNHSFIIPGFIAVIVATLTATGIAHILY